MTGSARPVIAWGALMLALLCVCLAFVSGVVNGLMLLATIFGLVFVWAVGGFTRSFWVDGDADRRLSRTAEAVDAEERMTR